MSRKFEIRTLVHELNSIEELNEEDKSLLLQAKDASDNAYAPYSDFNVGAALLLENGTVIKGNNQENAAYPSGLCAERVAIFAAGAQYPGVKIKTIAITAKSNSYHIDQPVSPCGACRQSMVEYEHRYASDIRLILMGQEGKVFILESVASLLPLVFSEKFLSQK